MGQARGRTAASDASAQQPTKRMLTHSTHSKPCALNQTVTKPKRGPLDAQLAHSTYSTSSEGTSNPIRSIGTGTSASAGHSGSLCPFSTRSSSRPRHSTKDSLVPAAGPVAGCPEACGPVTCSAAGSTADAMMMLVQAAVSASILISATFLSCDRQRYQETERGIKWAARGQ